jgi:hypothetical protein
VLACPNGRCGERIVLAGRNGLWYGGGRPEAFSCGGCGALGAQGERVQHGPEAQGCGESGSSSDLA